MAFFVQETCRFFFLRVRTSRTLRPSQRTILCGRDPKGGFKQPAEMRLIRKTSLKGDLDQGSVLCKKFSGKVKTAHEQIAVGTGPTHDPKLPGQLVAGESGQPLQLR